MATLPRAAALGNPFPLGSVSSGTLRPEDLIPAFVAKLDELKEDLSLSLSTSAGFDETQVVKARVSEIDDFLARIERDQQDPKYFDGENIGANWDMGALEDYLGTFAPPYVYFGAHPGDGADFGFWPDHDAIENDQHDGELLLVGRGADLADLSKVPADHSGAVCHVNDHGNTTLYQHDKGEFVELWSCV